MPDKIASILSFSSPVHIDGVHVTEVALSLVYFATVLSCAPVMFKRKNIFNIFNPMDMLKYRRRDLYFSCDCIPLDDLIHYTRIPAGHHSSKGLMIIKNELKEYCSVKDFYPLQAPLLPPCLSSSYLLHSTCAW